MKIGRFEIEQLSEGVFEGYPDGTYRKVNLEPRSVQPIVYPGSNFVHIGIDPILVRDGKHNILLDTGLGWGLDNRSTYQESSNLKTNLDIFGLTPSDITHVVLSHLHFDHIAGASYVDENISTQPTMPYANYFLQKKEWHYALEQINGNSNMPGAGYNLDEFYKLAAEDKLVFITDAYLELLPGVDIIRTGGHTPGHQIVKIYDKGETAYFLGDLIPSELHLNQYAMKKLDVDPIQAKKAKTLLLRQALEEEACLLFYHSIHTKAGILVQDRNRKFMLRKVD